MATVEDFYKIREPIIKLCIYLGTKVLTSDKRFHPMSYLLMLHMVAFNVCNLYTMIQVGSDVKQLMKTTVIVGIANQLVFKFFSMLAERRTIRSLFEVFEDCLYRKYQNGSQAEKEIIAKTNRFLDVFWKALFALYGSTLFVFGLWPVYVYYKDGELVPLFMYYIPLVSLEQTTGYLITMAFHIDCYIYGIVGCFVTEYAFIFLTLHALVSVDLFLLHLNELGVLLKSSRDKASEAAIEEKWKKCMTDHQFCTEALNTVEGIFSLIVLVQVFSCVFSICNAMLLVKVTDWYAAYCFLVVIFGQISIYFFLGNFVEIKVDTMYECITDIPWNLMSVQQQREFGFLMARTQRPLIFTILGFAPLNFESYMAVLKTLYQFFVMVLQYVE